VCGSPDRAAHHHILGMAVTWFQNKEDMFQLVDIDGNNTSMAGFHASEIDASLNSMH
jgi:hypothetical protein